MRGARTRSSPLPDPRRRNRTSLARSDAEKNDLDGEQQHQQIEREGVVLHVVEVVLQLFPRVPFRGAVAVADLRPAGDSRLDEVALWIKRNDLPELLNERGTLGPWPDEAHVTDENVEKLRQLVDSQPPDHPPNSGHPDIVLLGPDRAGLVLGIDLHAA